MLKVTDIKVGNNYQNINMANKVNNRTVSNVTRYNGNFGTTNIGVDFGTLLKKQLDRNSGLSGNGTELQFSKHAKERVLQRGIELTPELMDELNNAVDKANAKGAKDVVIFDTMNAFIVNVPNRTVVTTMSGNEMRENIFTNIDSAVIL